MGATVEPVWKHVRVETSSDDEFTHATVRGKHDLLLDESTELEFGGSDAGPSAVDLLVTSLVACQVSVLQQCFEKARIEEYRIESEATIDNSHRDDIPAEMPSNTSNRVEHIVVAMAVEVAPEYEDRARRCVDVYDQGCIVGQSFHAGITYTPEVSLSVAGD